MEYCRSNTVIVSFHFLPGHLGLFCLGTSYLRQEATPCLLRQRLVPPRQLDSTRTMKQTLSCSELQEAIVPAANPQQGQLQPCPVGRSLLPPPRSLPVPNQSPGLLLLLLSAVLSLLPCSTPLSTVLAFVPLTRARGQDMNIR